MEEPLESHALRAKMRVYSLVLLSPRHHRRVRGFAWSAGWNLGADSDPMGKSQSEDRQGLVENPGP